MSKPIQTSDILFPTLSTNFSATLSSLKRSTLSISNRLRSIDQDSEFVCDVADVYGLSLIANERCGSWYIPPERKTESAYFKSTDGHTGQWAFSSRRLNTQVLHAIAKHDGCVIVDSTRRGKRMPDALSKTVPIWCAVFNRIFFPNQSEAHCLYTPPQVVSPSEHSQIEALLEDFVQQARNLNLPLEDLRVNLRKPLRPVWVTQETDISADPPTFTDFHPVVLCTASRRVPGGEVSEGGYVQGAGDDAEGWAHGLTSQLYWAHRDELLQTSEEDLPDFIAGIIEASRSNGVAHAATLILPTTGLFVSAHGPLEPQDVKQYDGIIHCGEKADASLAETLKGRYIHLKCTNGKLGSRDLRKELPKIEGLFAAHAPFRRLLVTCQTGLDISVGVVLAILCLYTDENGHIHPQRLPTTISKPFIRQRLSWIMTSLPCANPSRTTLQSVNAYLMSSPPSSTSSPPFSPSPSQPHQSHHPTPLTPSLPRRIFTSLRGRWTLTRRITSRLSAAPSGTFRGTATFTPTPASRPYGPQAAEAAGAGAGAEYVYSEEGAFTTDAGLAFGARRGYVWRYDAAGDRIDVYFPKEEGETEERFFHRVEFASGGKEREGEEVVADAEGVATTAKGEHWCEPDNYIVGYEFMLQRTEMRRFELRYEVKGPQKDYTSEAWYEREGSG